MHCVILLNNKLFYIATFLINMFKNSFKILICNRATILQNCGAPQGRCYRRLKQSLYVKRNLEQLRGAGRILKFPRKMKMRLLERFDNLQVKLKNFLCRSNASCRFCVNNNVLENINSLVCA